MKVSNIVPLTLALWERVRLSYVSDLPSKQLSPEVRGSLHVLGMFSFVLLQQIIERLIGFVQKCKLFHNNFEVSVIYLQQ